MKEIVERLTDIDAPNGTFDEYINYLHQQIDRFKPKYSKFFFDCLGWDDKYYELMGYREETEKEREKRIKKAAKDREYNRVRKRKMLERKREQFEKLKKELGE